MAEHSARLCGLWIQVKRRSRDAMRSGVFRPCAAIEEYQFAGSILDVMMTFVHFASTEEPLSSTVSGYLSRTRFRNASSCSPENSSMMRISSPA